MRYLQIFILSLFCLNLNAQKDKLFLSTWQTEGEALQNITADKYTHFEKQKLNVHISNNTDIVLIYLKTDDPVVQNRILKEGLTVWISMDGKLNKGTGIRYPIGSQNSRGRRSSNIPQNTTDSNGNLITPLAQANTIELIGFPGEEERFFASDNADNFRGSIKYDNDGSLNYILVMPISKLALRNSKEGNGAMPFTLGFEYGVVPVTKGPGIMTPPPSESPAGGSRGGSGGGSRGGGGRSGGAPGGGGSPGTNPQNSSSSLQNSVPSVLLWVKNIKLATVE